MDLMAFFWALVSDWDLKKLSERNVIRVRSQMDGHELIELQNGAEYCICESTNPKGFTEAIDLEYLEYSVDWCEFPT